MERPPKNKIKTFIFLAIILLFAASLRVHTFYLPHNHGDQIFYLSLAMKLEKFGFAKYNLKGVDILRDGHILAAVESKDSQRGSLLRGLEQGNVFYYSEENLSNMPPAFSYLLMWSHKIFSPNKLFLSVDKNLGALAIFLRPKIFFQSQFYAVWLNFIFSLLFILMVFFLGRKLFNENVGLWSAFLISVAPVDMLTSQRLWTDEMASFFTVLCAFFFWQGRTKKNLLLMGLSGVCAGIGAITKQSGIFIVFIIICFEIIIRYIQGKTRPLYLIINKELMVFILSAFTISVFWYVRLTLEYGVPWYMPHQAGIEKVASWFMMISRRPRLGQLYYFLYLSPILIFFYIESITIVWKREFSPEKIFCQIWFILFIIFLALIPAREERYLLPAYPAIVILSSLLIEKIRKKINNLKGMKYLGDIAIITIFVFSSIWSIKLGLNCVFNNCAIFSIFN